MARQRVYRLRAAGQVSNKATGGVSRQKTDGDAAWLCCQEKTAQGAVLPSSRPCQSQRRSNRNNKVFGPQRVRCKPTGTCRIARRTLKPASQTEHDGVTTACVVDTPRQAGHRTTVAFACERVQSPRLVFGRPRSRSPSSGFQQHGRFCAQAAGRAWAAHSCQRRDARALAVLMTSPSRISGSPGNSLPPVPSR